MKLLNLPPGNQVLSAQKGKIKADRLKLKTKNRLFSLTLTDDDFKDSFAFCANGDEFVSTAQPLVTLRIESLNSRPSWVISDEDFLR